VRIAVVFLAVWLAMAIAWAFLFVFLSHRWR
jgi:hypothetical protein